MRFALVFEFLFRWGIVLSRVSFLSAGTTPTKQPKPPTNTLSGGQMWWDWGLPALHRHHSGTGRKDPKRQALWELALASGRLPVVFVLFFAFLCFFTDFR